MIRHEMYISPLNDLTKALPIIRTIISFRANLFTILDGIVRNVHMTILLPYMTIASLQRSHSTRSQHGAVETVTVRGFHQARANPVRNKSIKAQQLKVQ